MPFWLHFGSTLPPCWLHFGMIFRFVFWSNLRCVFFWFWCHSWPPQPSILMLSPRRRAIFPVFARSREVSKHIKTIPKLASKINQKSTQNQSKKQSKIISYFWLLFTPKMEPKWPQNGREKIGKNWPWAPWAAKGAPQDTEGTHGNPRTPKMEPKGPPEHSKWTPRDSPRDPQSPQHGAQ